MVLTSARAPLSRSVDDFSGRLAVVSSGRGDYSLMFRTAFGFPMDPEKSDGHTILMDVLGINVDLQ